MSAHRDSLEARLAFRTRLLDHIAVRDAAGRDGGRRAGRPRRVEGHGPGLAPGDVDGWTEALAELLDDDRAHAAASAAVTAAQEELSWSTGRGAARGADRTGRLVASPALVGDWSPPPRGGDTGALVARATRSPRDGHGRFASGFRRPPRVRVNAVATDERPVPVHGGGYDLKDTSYFAMARDDYVAALPDNPEASILEIGCSNGATGALALAQGKCRRYCGVELFPEPAAAARERLTEVVEGDVEQLELPWPAAVVRRPDPQRGARASARSMGRPRARAAAAPARRARVREHAERRSPRDHRHAAQGPVGASELRPARRDAPPLVLAVESPAGVRGSRLRGRFGRTARSARARAARSSIACCVDVFVTSGTGRSTCAPTCRRRGIAAP